MTTSIIYSFNKEELQKIVNESNTIKEVMKKVGLSTEGGNRKTLYRIFDEYKIDISKLVSNRNTFLDKQRKKIYADGYISNEKIFVINSTHTRKVVKTRILKENLIKYECKKCHNDGHWQNEKLILQLEHINGINNDNRLENLCFLCPNCHSQTSTFAGKKSHHYA